MHPDDKVTVAFTKHHDFGESLKFVPGGALHGEVYCALHDLKDTAKNINTMVCAN